MSGQPARPFSFVETPTAFRAPTADEAPPQYIRHAHHTSLGSLGSDFSDDVAKRESQHQETAQEESVQHENHLEKSNQEECPYQSEKRDQESEETIEQKRISAYSHVDLPEVVPGGVFEGKQVVAFEPQKETVVNREQPPEIVHQDIGKEVVGLEPDEVPKVSPVRARMNKRICGIRTKWVVLAAIVLAILAIALGAGLGAGLKKTESIRGSGALNGTRIALVTQTFDSASGGTEENLVMYYQHTNGHIRFMRQLSDGTWSGGDEASVVATDAKPKTPITAVSYRWIGNNFWRVYYIDTLNTVREVWNSNNTAGWALGPLSDTDALAYAGDEVGMVACWYGPFATDGTSQGFATTSNSTDLAVRLIYAVNETSFQEVTYHGDDQLYRNEHVFTNLNGRTTPACYNGDASGIDYMMFLDQQDNVNVFWRDSNTNATNSTTHPTALWTNSSVSIPNVNPSSEFTYLDVFYAQDRNDQTIKGFNITFAAENTSWESGSEFVVFSAPGVRGTGIGSTTQPNSAGGSDLLNMYQTGDLGISDFRRGMNGGDWTGTNISVPEN